MRATLTPPIPIKLSSVARSAPPRASGFTVRRMTPAARFLAGASAFALVFIAPWLLFLRPWARTWGATEAEVNETLPGDDLETRPLLSVSTRAVTIDAPPSAVWPWLVQMGCERGGFYTYDWIERLLGGGNYLEGHSADTIHPELQNLKVGDKIYLHPLVGTPITMMDSERYLVIGNGWIILLRELEGRKTRLIIRMKNAGFFPHSAPVLGGILSLVDIVLNWLGYDPGLDFFMVRRELLGIKQRVERTESAHTLVPGRPGESEGARG